MSAAPPDVELQPLKLVHTSDVHVGSKTFPHDRLTSSKSAFVVQVKGHAMREETVGACYRLRVVMQDIHGDKHDRCSKECDGVSMGLHTRDVLYDNA